jgi:hypothetical protein
MKEFVGTLREKQRHVVLACSLGATIIAWDAFASPVVIHIGGNVLEENCLTCTIPDPFGGFLSAGDSYQATIRFNTDHAIREFVSTSNIIYELVGATALVFVNGFEFVEDPSAPILVGVRNHPTGDKIEFDVSTVPVDSARKPLESGPHGVTEFWFIAQDNSHIALTSTDLPNHLSPIWKTPLQRFEFVSDPIGQCSLRGCENGFPGIASLSVVSLVVTVPEPSTAIMLMVCGGALFTVSKRQRTSALL